LCCSSENIPKIDYKHLLKALRLTPSQKRLLYALCQQPTAHVFAVDYMAKHGLTLGGIRSALDRLDNLCLIKRDSAEVWRLANPGMQAWLHLLLTTNDPEKAEHLRFGEWDGPTSKQLVLTKAVLRAAEQLNITTPQLASVLGVGRTTGEHLVSGNYDLSMTKKEWELGTLFVRMNIALDVLVGGSQADAQKWLNSGNTAFGGQKPIQLIPTIEGLVRVVQYLESVDK
jgi:hypothetical protein